MATTTAHHLENCMGGQDITCPDCTDNGIIISTDCTTCGGCRWIHRCAGQVWNPTDV